MLATIWGSFDWSKLLYLKTKSGLKANKTSNQEWECFHHWVAEMAEGEGKAEASSLKARKASSALFPRLQIIPFRLPFSLKGYGPDRDSDHQT